MGQANPTIRRWVDLAVLTALSLLILVSLYPQFAIFSYNLGTALLVNRPVAQHFIIALVSLCLWFLLIRLGGFRLKDLTRSIFLRYPPIWSVGIFGLIIYLLYAGNKYGPELSGGEPCKNKLIIGASMFLGFVSAVLLDKFFAGRRREERKKEQTPSGGAKNLSDMADKVEHLIEWIKDESPIDHPDKAMFGLQAIASRITDLLTGSKLKTIGVVGPYGSGKSSLLNLIEHYTPQSEKSRFKGHTIFCRIDGWGRIKGSIAQQILAKAVDSMKSEVDCLSIITLPVHYSKTLSGTGNKYLSTAASLLGGDEDPVRLLEKMDDILMAVDKRLIIFLEDLDRNTSDASIRDEMPALLDRLRNLENVSFVLAIGTERHYSVDLIRICDHVEGLTMISLHDLGKIIGSFSKHCLSLQPADKAILTARDCLEIDGFFAGFNDVKRPLYHAGKLINSPRLLKMILRRTLSAWNILHGEVDFCDLLVVNILRFGAPEAFDFLLSNISEVRELEYGGLQNNKEEKKKHLQQIWDAAIRNEPWKADAAENLISYLFPFWNIKYQGSKDVPHGVRHATPTDYWIRATTENIPTDEIRDQEVIRAIHGWKTDRADRSFRKLSLPEALYKTEDIAGKFEYIGRYLLDGDDVRKLASAYLNLLLDDRKFERRPAWMIGPNAYSSLARLLSVKRIEKDKHFSWLKDEIIKALPANLDLATELYSKWKHFHSGYGGDKPYPEVSKFVIDKAKDIFKTPEVLLNAIEYNPAYSVASFTHVFSAGLGNDVKASEWSWLANVLLEAAKKRPDIAVPQICRLIFERDETRVYEHEDEVAYTYKEELAKHLFDVKLPEVMKLLADEVEYPKMEDHEKAIISFAHQFAVEWLKQNSSGS